MHLASLAVLAAATFGHGASGTDAPGPAKDDFNYGNGTAASCGAECREGFKNRTLLSNVASAATMVIDRMDLWQDCWDDTTCQNAVAMMVGDTAARIGQLNETCPGNTTWTEQCYGDFMINMGNKAALDAMSGTYSILKTLVADVKEPDELSPGERKILWDIGQLSAAVEGGYSLDHEVLMKEINNTVLTDDLPLWFNDSDMKTLQTHQLQQRGIQTRDDGDDGGDDDKYAPMAVFLSLPFFIMAADTFTAKALEGMEASGYLVKMWNKHGTDFTKYMQAGYQKALERGAFDWLGIKPKPRGGGTPPEFTGRTQIQDRARPPKKKVRFQLPQAPQNTGPFPWNRPDIPDAPTCGVPVRPMMKRSAGECLMKPWKTAEEAVTGGMKAVEGSAGVASDVIGSAAAAGKTLFDAADPIGGFLSFIGHGAGHHGGGHHGHKDDHKGEHKQDHKDDHKDDHKHDHNDKPSHHTKTKPAHETKTHHPTTFKTSHTPAQSEATSTASGPSTTSTSITSSAQITSPPTLLPTSIPSISTTTITADHIAIIGQPGIATVPVNLAPCTAVPAGNVAVGTFQSQCIVAPTEAFPSSVDVASVTSALGPMGVQPTAL